MYKSQQVQFMEAFVDSKEYKSGITPLKQLKKCGCNSSNVALKVQSYIFCILYNGVKNIHWKLKIMMLQKLEQGAKKVHS